MMPITTRLIDGLGTTEALEAAFADEAMLQAMLDFEVALARVEARLGLIPADAAAAIARAATLDRFDIAELARGARLSATISVPFVDQLRASVEATDPASSVYVHRGATSQDLCDTALVCCIRRAGRIMAADHLRLTSALAKLSDEHAGTVMLGRTLLQPALPVTFGLKAAAWFAALTRSWSLLSRAFSDANVLQFGGAAGTLAALGPDGTEVEEALAGELQLAVPDAPWHTHRDRLAALVASCGIHAGVLGKIARDVSLLMQAEIGEVAERGGGSSTMPHKRNPAGCAVVLAAAVRLPGLVSTFLSGMTQEHERSVGGWHAEAPTLSATVQATGSALSALADVIEHLTVFPDRMLANLTSTRGVVFAEKLSMLIGPRVGQQQGTLLVKQAVTKAREEGRPFHEVVQSIPELAAILSPDELGSIDEAGAYLGSAETFRQRLITTSLSKRP